MLIIIVLAIIILFVLLAYRIFVRKIISEKNQQCQVEIQYQKNLLKQNVETQESERERIAILVHDDIGNKLNVLSVWLNNPDTWNSDRSKEIILKQVPDLIETTRSISHALYPVNLERFGLISAIDNLIANVENSLIIELILKHEYTDRQISFEVQLYRIIQEFISNVLKHSEANKMFIQIRDSDNSLCILLSDNGKGFDVKSKKMGMGLRNIDLRLKSMDAVYKWKSKTNKGSRLIIMVPKS